MPPSTANELIAEVEARVASGALKPGDRLPSVRIQARNLDLAPNTVASAYRRLRERGVVAGRGRQGTLVAERPLVAAMMSSDVPAGIVDAMTGNPDPALLPDPTSALLAAVAGDDVRYGRAMVDPELHAVGAALLRADGVDASRLTVVNGAMDAVERLLMARLRPGDTIGVEDPGYASVLQLVTALGFVAAPMEVDPDGVLPHGLERALERGATAVILTPRGHNPTGAAISVQRCEDVNSVLARHPETFVVEDDHAGPVAGVGLATIDRDRRHWAVVRSMSKSLGPDLRVALVAGDHDTVDRVEGRLQVGPGWVSHLLQRTAAHLLVDPKAQAAVRAAAATYSRRRGRMLEALMSRGTTATGPSGLHVWVPVADEQAVVMGMREAGFAVRSGGHYRIDTPPAVRITTAALSDAEIDALADAMHTIHESAASRSRMA